MEQKQALFSDDIKAQMKSVPLFSGLDDEALSSLYKISTTRKYPKENVLFLQGETGDAFYLILEGEVKVMFTGTDGKEYILALFQAGDFFGEMSVFDRQPRSASVITTETSSFLIIHREAFLTHVTRIPEIMSHFFSTLCSRLRRTDEQVGDLALLKVYARIVKTLLMLGEMIGEPGGEGIKTISKRPTHQDIASMVGTTRETVSRVFNELKQHGNIVTSGRKLIIREASLRDYLDALSKNLY